MLGEERGERARDKERWDERMKEVEKGAEGIVGDLEAWLQVAEKQAIQGVGEVENKIVEAREERMEKTERLQSKITSLDREQHGERQRTNDHLSGRQFAPGPTDAELEAPKEKLDEANKGTVRVTTLLSLSPKEWKELLERNKVLLTLESVCFFVRVGNRVTPKVLSRVITAKTPQGPMAYTSAPFRLTDLLRFESILESFSPTYGHGTLSLSRKNGELTILDVSFALSCNALGGGLLPRKRKRGVDEEANLAAGDDDAESTPLESPTTLGSLNKAIK
ncbi:hypothetical protein B0H11DRAFT_2335768 [Mycena galericulata]|nr:hypothetical protein B0H11DRAFT_2335768 [Mycena galericulata]